MLKKNQHKKTEDILKSAKTEAAYLTELTRQKTGEILKLEEEKAAFLADETKRKSDELLERVKKEEEKDYITFSILT